MPITIRSSRPFPVPCAMMSQAGGFLKRPRTYVLGFGSLIRLPLLSRGPASAEWVRISGDSQGAMTVSGDPDTSRRKGTLVAMWDVGDGKDHQASANGSFLSSTAQREYD